MMLYQRGERVMPVYREPPLRELSDEAQQALSHAYYLITGKSPQWSAKFTYDDALHDIFSGHHAQPWKPRGY